MRRLLADVRAFGVQYLRSPMGAFFTFAFPVLLILLFGAIFTPSSVQRVGLTVQDLDGSNTSREFLSILNQTNSVSVTLVSPDQSLVGYIRDHSLSVALQIPAGFGTRAAAHAPVNVTLFGDPSASTYSVVRGLVEAGIVHLNYLLNQAQPIVGLEATTVASSQFNFMDFFLPGIVGMTVMTSSMYSMTSITADYRSRHYFQLLATTPLGKTRWLAAKVVFYFLVLVASLLITVLVSRAVFGTTVTLNWLAFVFIAAGAVLFASFGMLFGWLAKEPDSAVAVANAVGFPMMFLAGTFWQLDLAPTYLQQVAQVLPLTYLNEGLRDAMVYANWNGAFANLAVVVAVAAGLFVLSARLVSWRER